jgi:hypothetical protein
MLEIGRLLLGGWQVGLVDDHGGLGILGVLGGRQVGGLGDQAVLVESARNFRLRVESACLRSRHW